MTFTIIFLCQLCIAFRKREVRIIRGLLVKLDKLGYVVTVENRVFVIKNKVTKEVVAEMSSDSRVERRKFLQKYYDKLKQKTEDSEEEE